MLKLTKKFQNEGLVGQDPVKGFQRALDRQGANVRFAALCHCQLLPPSKEAHLAAGHLDQLPCLHLPGYLTCCSCGHPCIVQRVPSAMGPSILLCEPITELARAVCQAGTCVLHALLTSNCIPC